MSLLGLDIGTSNVKGSAYSAEGKLLARSSREHPTLRPRSGWAELDSRAVVESVKSVIRQVGSATAADPITAISVSAMGEAMTPVSAEREILGNAVLAVADSRGAEYIEALEQDFGRETLYSINPNIPSPNYSLPKLLWVRENNKELFKRTDKFLLFGELVFYLLGCEAETSYSQANRTMLFDIKAEDWSDRILQATGLSRDLLPRAVPSGKILGTLPAKAAAELNLAPGVICVVGAHDQCCNALGAGVYEPGKAVCGIGTVECIAPVYGSIPDTAKMLSAGLNIEHHAIPGRYTSFIYNQAGSLVKWYRDTFASADSRLASPEMDLFAQLDAEMPTDPTRLLVLPYFEPTGAPGFITDVSGMIVGLSMSTKRGDVLKAILECETFYFLDSLYTLKSLGIDTTRFVATGGGSKSDFWLQIKADIFGVPFERSATNEAGTLGAAMIAATATGVTASYAEAVERFVKPGRIFYPDEKRHGFYREKYGRYSELYPRIKDILAWTSS